MSGWCPNLPYQNFDSIRYFGSYRQFAKELLFMRIFPPFSHPLQSNFDRRRVKESIADFRLANRWQNLVGQAMASPKQMPPDLEFYSDFFSSIFCERGTLLTNYLTPTTSIVTHHMRKQIKSATLARE
jgi:hypothetical protein